MYISIYVYRYIYVGSIGGYVGVYGGYMGAYRGSIGVISGVKNRRRRKNIQKAHELDKKSQALGRRRNPQSPNPKLPNKLLHHGVRLCFRGMGSGFLQHGFSAKGIGYRNSIITLQEE